uniref:Uncharacterized protein n=1 Tax=Chromera velia CCMP2878 TaxID=1169474 RepID=A0A0G4HGS9_9ALVE|eukprot:Cvel_1021.t1-p1 / transcript=Cvel_1021.t1 / gene=Cvel_1021 / organism=Chromera_velia_CCMP2878 / gene_product=Probable UDP-N-acetylglucosamine--peptide, putative / transcript_product=Probable UDP-N-acetylglucosamine--peptide, putative / location=Cvel_scaffold33:100040-104400(-) / protein_length=468 / sequence_SO=supercontig / SO=protein_coding / is_pseudo=false
MAVRQFDQALQKLPFYADAHFYRGTALVSLRRYAEALESLEKAVEIRGTHAPALVNLAVVHQIQGSNDKAVEACQRALSVDPQCTEAVMNLSNILRNSGRRAEAIHMLWEKIIDDEKEMLNAGNGEKEEETGDETFRESSRTQSLSFPLDVSAMSPLSEENLGRNLHVVCVKWGSLYSAAHVNALFQGVGRCLGAFEEGEWRFICFTDEGGEEGLDPSIETRRLPEHLKTWWGKAYLFAKEAGLVGLPVVYLDLDIVVCGDLSPLADLARDRSRPEFALLSTNDIKSELAQDGFNSTVMVWRGRPELCAIFDRLTKSVLRFVHRFDHWLEMIVRNALLVDAAFPRLVVDFCQHFGVPVGLNWSAGGDRPSKVVEKEEDNSLMLKCETFRNEEGAMPSVSGTLGTKTGSGGNSQKGNDSSEDLMQGVAVVSFCRRPKADEFAGFLRTDEAAKQFPSRFECFDWLLSVWG